jgi:hypothetical protein
MSGVGLPASGPDVAGSSEGVGISFIGEQLPASSTNNMVTNDEEGFIAILSKDYT